MNTPMQRSQATRDKISAAMMGHSVSPETRAKMSAAKKGKKRPAEVVAKIAAGNRGQKRTKAQIQIFRAAALKMWARHRQAANNTVSV
jgi:plasmid stability protein